MSSPPRAEEPAEKRGRAALATGAVAIVSFALGALAFALGRPDAAPQGAPPAEGSARPHRDDAAPPSAAPEPRIAIDPASIELLPDASLRLDLPRPPSPPR